MSERIPDLVSRLRLDTRDLDKAKVQVANFGKSLEGAAGGGGKLAGVTQLVTNRLQGFAGSSNLVTKNLGALEKAGISSGTAISGAIGLGAVAAGAALAKFVGDGVAKFVALTAQIRLFQRVSGATARDASLLVGAMKLLGIEPANAAKAFGILSKVIENTPAKLTKFGVEIARNKDGTVNLTETLFRVSDAFHATGDQAEKNTIALTAFGRGGLELVPILARGREGLEAFNKALERRGLVFDQDALDQGKDLSLQLRQMRQSFDALEIRAARALVPFITGLAKASTAANDFSGDIERVLGERLGKTLKRSFGLAAIGQIGGPVAQVLSLLGHGHDKVAASAEDMAAAEQEAAEATAEVEKQAQAAIKQMDDFARALGRVQGAGQSLLGDQLSVADAVAGLAKSAAEVEAKRKAAAAAPRGSAAAKKAEDELAESRRAHLRDIDAEAKAVANLAVTQATAGGKAVTDAEKTALSYRTQRDEIIKAKDAATDPAIKAALIAAVNDLKPPDVVANLALDTQVAERKVEDLKNRVAKVGGDPDGPGPLPPPLLARRPAKSDGIKKAEVDVDPAPAAAKIAALKSSVADITTTVPTLNINTTQANAKLEALRRQIIAFNALNPAAVGPSLFGPLGQKRHEGGFMAGSLLPFPGLRPREIPAVLTHGEYVLRERAVKRIGVPMLDRMNRMHLGGEVRVPTLAPIQVPTLAPGNSSGDSSGISGGTQVVHHHHNTFEVRATDPAAVADEVSRILSFRLGR